MSKIKGKTLFGRFVSKWQDLVVWLPGTIIVALAAYYLIPQIDPRAGIDGWGDLFAALIAGIKGVMATIGAWFCKSLYWYEPDDGDEADRRAVIEQNIVALNPAIVAAAMRLQVLDRLEFAAWLAFWSWVLF